MKLRDQKDNTLVDLFEEQALKAPLNIAISFDSKELSYQSLNESANRIAHFLKTKVNVIKEEPIGLYLDRSMETVVCILAVLKAGCAYVPIDVALPSDRINSIVNDANIRVILTQSLLYHQLKLFLEMSFSGCFLCVDEGEVKNSTLSVLDSKIESFGISEIQLSSSANLPKEISGASLAYIIFTSGTTGSPKGVMIEHKSVIQLIKNSQSIFNFNDGDVWLLFHSYAFDFSVWEIFGALLFGGRLIIASSSTVKDPKLVMDLIYTRRITILNQTPSSFYCLQLAHLQRDSLDLKIRCILFGGEVLQAGRLKKWVERYPQIRMVNAYGVTEASILSTYKDITIDEIDVNKTNIGKPFPLISCYVLDPKLKMLPRGVPGELYIGGDGVGRGYLNSSKLSNEKFLKDPFKIGRKMYKTGDSCRVLPDLNIEFLGRLDNQVKIKGYRIEIGDIEHALMNIRNVDQAIVRPIEDINGESELVAYLIGSPSKVSEIRSLLKEKIPGYMIPSYIMWIDSFPLTFTGKIDHSALPSPFENRERLSEISCPRNETEARLLNIWKEVLGVQLIGLDDNFFEIGGHSLKAMRLGSHLIREFKVEILLKDLFSHTTIEAQALLVEKASRSILQNIVPASPAKYYDLSSSQMRLWLTCQLHGANIAHNVSSVYKIEGGVKQDILNISFLKMIERHEILRTIFVKDESENIKQCIQSYSSYLGQISNLEIKSEELAIKVETLIKEPFDLERGPLIRLTLLHISSKESVLVCSMHHIISDGWSLEVFFRELIILYNSFRTNSLNSLKPLSIQYKDFAMWEQKRKPELTEMRNYWLNFFLDLPSKTELPFITVRPGSRTFGGKTIQSSLDTEINSFLSRITVQSDCTIFMALTAALNVLLFHYTDQVDIILNTPMAGRNHPDLEDQIGFYINMVPIRTKFDGSYSFYQMLSEVKKGVISSHENQSYPFGEFSKNLEFAGQFKRIFGSNVVIELNNVDYELSMPETEGLRIQRLSSSDTNTSKFDLNFSFIQRSNTLYFNLEYNTDLYSDNDAHAIILHFKKLLQSLSLNPDTPIQSLRYIDKYEKSQLFQFGGSLSTNVDRTTIVELFKRGALRNPNNLAIISENVNFTFNQLDEVSNKFANYLQSLGVERGFLVPICMEPSPRMVIAILSILKCGSAYIPIDTNDSINRIQYILDDSRAKYFLTDLRNESRLNQSISDNIHTVIYERIEPLLGTQSELDLPIDVSFTDLAYIIYTSGSSGKPKGVMVEHGNLISYLTNDKIDYCSSDCSQPGTYMTLSISFDASVTSLFLPLLHGKSIVIGNKSGASVFDDDLFIRYAPYDFLKLTPSHLALLESEIYKWPNDKIPADQLIIGGEILRPRHIKFLSKRFPEVTIVNEYGPTEATVGCTIYKFKMCDIETSGDEGFPIGFPLNNIQLKIVNREGDMVPIGVVGEIQISGPQIARGYLNLTDLTQSRFINANGEYRTYRSGDLGCWNRAGVLMYVGRIDDQVKINGYRIELAEIERVIENHSNVYSCVVLSRELPNQDREIATWIVSEGLIDESPLIQFVRQNLPVYMVPNRFTFLSTIPRNKNGKIDKEVLWMDLDSSDTQKINIAPRTMLEQKLVQIWKEVMGIEKFGVKDDFFSLGGHSLKAVQLVNKLRKEFGVNVGMDEVFENADIESQAKIIGMHLAIKDLAY